MRPYLEKTYHKNRTGGVAQGVGPEFKPQYRQKKKKKRIQKPPKHYRNLYKQRGYIYTIFKPIYKFNAYSKS
jgi:hypothetical protein